MKSETRAEVENRNLQVVDRIIKELTTNAPIRESTDRLDCCNIEIFPHQIETVERATKEYPVRVMLADEPGLGKTIEAGLIIKKLKPKIERVLIVAPSGVLRQWESELLLKLSLPAKAIMAGGIPSAESFYDPICIISMDYFARHVEKICDLGWDLLILDECHHFAKRYERQEPSLRNRAAEFACNKISNVLLLTATPMQLGLFDFWSLLHLIRADSFPDYGTFKGYMDYFMPQIRELHASSNAGHNIEKRLSDIESRLRRLFSIATGGTNLDARLHSLDFINTIVIRHRKREEMPLVRRNVSTIPVKYSNQEKLVYADISRVITKLMKLSGDDKPNGLYLCLLKQLLASSSRAFLATIRARKLNLKVVIDDPEASDADEYTVPEQELAILEEFEGRLKDIRLDSKANALIAFITKTISENPDARIIIFTRFIQTQLYLARLLSKQLKKRVGIFNGAMSGGLKERVIKDFKADGNVLISTEAGGEGRNLQFSNIIINYDLQWNPVRLEQRIGRIDRIGQRKDIYVFNLASWNTIEQDMHNRLAERIELWSKTLGYIDPILGELEDDMNKIDVTSSENCEAMRKLLETKIRESEQTAKAFGEMFSFNASCRKQSGDESSCAKVNSERSSDMPKSAADANSTSTIAQEEYYAMVSKSVRKRTIFVLVKDVEKCAVALVMNSGEGWKLANPYSIPVQDADRSELTEIELMDLKNDADSACQYVARMSGFQNKRVRPKIVLEVRHE